MNPARVRAKKAGLGSRLPDVLALDRGALSFYIIQILPGTDVLTRCPERAWEVPVRSRGGSQGRTVGRFSGQVFGAVVRRNSYMSVHPLEGIIHPKTIAVAGASDSGRGGGFVTPLQELGFKGTIYPVNPKYDTIMGLTG